MLTPGNVHRLVPKGGNSGLNGISVQPMGIARNRCFGSPPEYELATILWPCSSPDFHQKKNPSPSLERKITHNGCLGTCPRSSSFRLGRLGMLLEGTLANERGNLRFSSRRPATTMHSRFGPPFPSDCPPNPRSLGLRAQLSGSGPAKGVSPSPVRRSTASEFKF
jgi:hypothetical protein